MKQIKPWLFAAILIICATAAAVIVCRHSDTQNNNAADSDNKTVTIAIAWRADTTSEFCTNMVETLKEAGANVVILPQVKAPYVEYNGANVSATCLDAEGIGYLSARCAQQTRSTTHRGTNVQEALRGVDGVIFTGGEDISPTLLATPQDWHHIEAEIDYNAARDVSDYLTMTYCLDNDIPLMGFCRGAQMLGVVSGATMIQDIPTWFAQQSLPYHDEHRREKAAGETYRDYAAHAVTLANGSLLARYFSTTALSGCPSWHHQALLSTEGTPLRVTGTTTMSGISMVEGIERTDKRCALGVQFHPEAAIAKHIGKAVNNANASQFMPYETAIQLFRAFIEECKK